MQSGEFLKQVGGYEAFVPNPLPPLSVQQMDAEMTALLSEADHALGRLDGVTSILPNPNLFVSMYVKHEAVLSSQIEGTQSTLQDVLSFDIHAAGKKTPKDIEEVFNYVAAMNHGLIMLGKFPLSLRLIREIHGRLLQRVRGSNQEPGEFRKHQNWLGPEGCSMKDATFIPPPPDQMLVALQEFERFLHHEGPMPALIHCGLCHAQFETIHPFLDGNGRVGRLLITFLLCKRGVLQRPLLYLSHYLKLHRSQYYDRLTAIRRDGDWEGWLKFFLRGVAEVSGSATTTAREILNLRERARKSLGTSGNANYGHRLLDSLFDQPIVTVATIQTSLSCSFVKANSLAKWFVELGLLNELTGGRRNRLFRFTPYMKLFEPSVEVPGELPLTRRKLVP